MRKMTKIFAFCAFSTLALTGGYKVSAATTTVDGITWNYTLQDGKAADVYAKSGQSRNLVIPDKLNGYVVVSIGGGTETTPVASGINTVQIPESVNRINDYAFSGDSNLESNNLEDVEEGMVIGDNIDYIGTAAFKDCAGIKKIDICNFNGNIGDSAFENCTGITQLYVPGVDSLGNYVFNGCVNLENLEVNYPTLSNQFQECPSLTNIVCDEKVESVGADTFMVSSVGVYKEKNDTDDNVGTNQQVISAALCNKKNYKTFLNEGSTRNWFFKNPNTALTPENITIKKNDAVGFEGVDSEGAKVRGYYKPLTYSCNSIFFPKLEANVYEIWDGNIYDNTYLQSNFRIYGLASGKGTNLEYYNTPSGYALNKVYVSCTGEPGQNTPEYAQESHQGTIWESMAAQCVQIYDLQDTSVDVEIPEYVPAHKVAISASYNGTVTEGMEVDTTQITITNYYSDNSTEDIVFSDDSMSLTYDKIQVGTNTVTLLNDGFSCTFEIEGIEKKLVSLTTELNTSALTDKSGYNSDNKTFLEGSVLSKDMFIVTGIYDNGESEKITDFIVKQDKVISGENKIEISYKDFTTCVTIIGREKRLVSVNVVLNASALTDKSGYNSDNKTFLEGSVLSKDMFVVTGIYDNGDSEAITDFIVKQDKVIPGENKIEISYKDFITCVTIAGREKQPVSINAVLNTSNLDSNSAYDNTKGAFLVGSSLRNNMFTVTVQYNNGDSEEITDFSLNQNQLVEGNNSIEISYKGVSTNVTVTAYSKEATPGKDTSNGSTTPGENTSNMNNDTNTNTSAGSTPSPDASENDLNSDKKDATPNKDNNKNKPSKDKKPSKDNKPSKDKKPSKGNKLSKDKKPSKGNKLSKDKKPSKDKKASKDKITTSKKKTAGTTTFMKKSTSKSSTGISDSQGSIPVYVNYDNAENPSVDSKDDEDEVNHSNKKKKKSNKDKDDLQEEEKTLNKEDDRVTYDSIDSDSKYDSNEVVEADMNKKVDVSKKKSRFSPVFIVLVIIGIAVVGFILNRRNKEEDEEDDDESQQ